jgi:hypothetical protein
MASSFEREVSFPYPYMHVFDAAVGAHRSKRMDVYKVEPHTGEIKAFTGASLASYGEKIEIFAQAHSPTSSSVKVVSQCQTPMTVIDWGKNRKNVEATLANIDAYLKSMPPPPADPAAPPVVNAPPVVKNVPPKL